MKSMCFRKMGDINMFIPDGIEERRDSSGIMPLWDWTCFPRGGVALNRNVGSLYMIKTESWVYGADTGHWEGQVVEICYKVGRENVEVLLLLQFFQWSKNQSHQLRVSGWVEIFERT